MKYLVPVDISQHSSDALKYIIKKASKNDEIVVYNVHNGFVKPSTVGNDYYPTMDTKNKRELIGILVDVCNPPANGPKISIEMENGEIVHTIVNKARSEEFDAIIMGTKDEYGMMEKLFGTISTGVVRLTDIPVYLIPKDQEYVKNQKVLIATDQHMIQSESMNDLLGNVDTKGSHFIFYHVNDLEESNKKFDTLKLKEALPKSTSNFKVDFEEEYHVNVTTAVMSKADEENCDLIVVVAESSNWIANIFNNSVSKELIMKGTKPMLFLPVHHSLHDQVSKRLRKVIF